MFAATQNTETALTNGYTRRLSRALFVATGIMLATATVASAEGAAPAAPSQQEVAILRDLLGIAPMAAPAEPTVVASQPVAPIQPESRPSAAAPAKSETVSGTGNGQPTSDNSGLAATPGYQLARAIMAAKIASQRVQVASR